jgi:pimeloyl-ACP methyl ester carboxylesterase
MDTTALTYTLSHGATLGYALYGSTASNATIMFYFHSTPSSRLEAAIMSPFAAQLGIRLISVDRPGMGLSTFQPDRQILDWPRDIDELADHLEVRKFAILAYSGGSPYAFTCARVMPPTRLLAVEIIAGIYPFKTTPSPFFVLFQSTVTTGITRLAGSSMEKQWGALARNPDPTGFYEAGMKHMSRRPENDRKALQGYEKIFVFDPMIQAFIVDGRGVGLEMKLQALEWGFDLMDIRCGGNCVKLSVWHGVDDGLVALSTAKKAAGSMVGAEFQPLENQGHCGVLIFYSEAILKHALDRMGVKGDRKEEKS